MQKGTVSGVSIYEYLLSACIWCQNNEQWYDSCVGNATEPVSNCARGRSVARRPCYTSAGRLSTRNMIEILYRHRAAGNHRDASFIPVNIQHQSAHLPLRYCPRLVALSFAVFDLFLILVICSGTGSINFKEVYGSYRKRKNAFSYLSWSAPPLPLPKSR